MYSCTYIVALFKILCRIQWRNQGEANGQLPISFGGLPIVIFISKFLPIEMSELPLKGN
jgi:hypothetical protein